MRSKWPRRATVQQRAAIEEFLRRAHTPYPGRILSTVLFGSVARGDFDTDSDIDLLLIAEPASRSFEREVWSLSFDVSLEFDVILDPHVYSRGLWESLCVKGHALCRNIEREGIELATPSLPPTSALASPP